MQARARERERERNFGGKEGEKEGEGEGTKKDNKKRGRNFSPPHMRMQGDNIEDCGRLSSHLSSQWKQFPLQGERERKRNWEKERRACREEREEKRRRGFTRDGREIHCAREKRGR